jgi:hypothetical protein
MNFDDIELRLRYPHLFRDAPEPSWVPPRPPETVPSDAVPEHRRFGLLHLFRKPT